MNKPTRQIMDELEEPDSCLCYNENSCCIIYIFKPFVNKIIKPFINIFKPCCKAIKKTFTSCFMSCDSCSLGCINIVEE